MEARIVLSEFKRSALGKFTELCQNLLIALTGNPYFLTPTPTLAVFGAAIDELVARTGAAESGDRTKINLRDDQREIVQNLVYELSNYILFASNGDVTKIESTTLKVAKQPVRRTSPMPPAAVEASAPGVPGSGKVKLKWSAVKGVTYVIEATTGDPAMPQTEWNPIGVSTKASFVAEDLTTNVYWSFRIICVNPAGMSEPSIAVSTIVA